MTTTISGTSGISTSSVTATGTVDAATVEGNTVTQDTVAMPRMVLSTAQATTSGTSIDFTGIPSWVKRITVMFNGVSTNGTGSHWLQIGSGSIDATGYTNASAGLINAVAVAVGVAAGNAAFLISTAVATTTIYGHLTLQHMGGNTWSIAGVLLNNDSQAIRPVAGSKTLAGAVDRIRLTTSNGTDTFDAGSVNIMYEG